MSKDPVSIQILGSGDAFGSGGNFQTSFLVSGKDFHFLIDCGATALISMKRYYVSPSLIDTILLTHLHGDHFSGISFFLLDAFYVQKRRDPLHIIGPQGTEEKVFKALELFYPGVDPKEFSYYIRFKEFTSYETFERGPLSVETFPVVHAEESKPHAFRINFHGRTLGFSGDTSWDDNLYKVAKDADLFMCECNFYNTVNSNHLNYIQLEEKLETLSCKKIYLNHLGEEMLSAIDHIKLPVAEEGQIITL